MILDKEALNALYQLALRKNPKAASEESSWYLKYYGDDFGFNIIYYCLICNKNFTSLHSTRQKHGYQHLKEYNLLALI